MITYRPKTAYSLDVLLDGKLVGSINETSDTEMVEGHSVTVRRYQYWPKGPRSEGGTKFATIGACKRSLEGE